MFFIFNSKVINYNIYKSSLKNYFVKNMIHIKKLLDWVRHTRIIKYIDNVLVYAVYTISNHWKL